MIETADDKGKVISKMIIDTPDGTVAKYVYTDHAGNRVYYDGWEYWVVDKKNRIEYYN